MSKMSRKGFLEPKGFTCNNWYNSWSFIDLEKKIICFTGWIDLVDDQGRYKIFDTSWIKSSPGYKQAVKHIEKIELGGYSLQILKTEANEGVNVIPRKVKQFWPVMRTCLLSSDNGIYYATPIRRQTE